MAFVKNIDGIPVYSTISEAISWGRTNLNLNGYHIHMHNGNKTYMGGLNHEVILEAQYEKYLNNITQQVVLKTDTQQTVSSPPPPEVELETPPEVEDQEENQTNNNQVFRTSGGGGGTGSTGGGGGGGY